MDFELEKQRIGGLIDALKKKLVIDKVQSEEKVQELIDAQRARLLALDNCVRYLQWEPQAAQLEQAVDEYDASFSSLGLLTSALQKMYTGDDLEGDCKRREESMTASLGAAKLAGEQLVISQTQLKADRAKLQQLEGALVADLATAGYQGIEQARGLLVSEVQQKNLLAEKGKIEQVLTGSGEQLELLTIQWKEAAVGDDPAISKEQQQAMVLEIEASLKDVRDKWKDKYSSLQGDDRLREQLGSYEEERKAMQDALKPWEMLNKLIGDKTGNKFNNIAQDLTLDHLLILANQRLGKLHSRYKILSPSDDDDLRVEDGYMGNEVRTVRSLSGGETFVLSLALALGLSDLASRDIRIDSLFVDEGFGSLDPETLEEAMTTLEQLQTESNKMVGIISHVESLKERIYTQIRLTKGNSGFSTLSIFPDAGSSDESK